jgi:DNA-binding response OmpR family regulator
MSDSQVVVAEDDGAIRELVAHHLRREGYGVLPVADGQAALRAGRSVASALVLDLGLPGMDGLDVTRALRREGSTLPIVVLTARAEEIDRVLAFEVGADDYVCKPFSARELVARLKAILRRNVQTVESPRVRRIGRLEIDDAAREARVDGSPLPLRPQEYALLAIFARNAGVALSREQLIDKAWGLDFCGDPRTVDVHVGRIRRVIEGPYRLGLIETLRGFGYKFRAQ